MLLRPSFTKPGSCHPSAGASLITGMCPGRFSEDLETKFLRGRDIPRSFKEERVWEESDSLQTLLSLHLLLPVLYIDLLGFKMHTVFGGKSTAISMALFVARTRVSCALSSLLCKSSASKPLRKRHRELQLGTSLFPPPGRWLLSVALRNTGGASRACQSVSRR